MARATVRTIPSIEQRDVRFVLVEGSRRILPELTEELSGYGLQQLRERGIDYATWAGWYKLDEAERALGEADTNFPRERKKIVEWEDMLNHSRASE